MLVLACLLIGASCATTQQQPPTAEASLRSRVGASMLDAGREAEARGDYPSAQAYYRSAYERDNKSPEAALALSRTLRRLARPREAIAIAERGLQANAHHPQLLAELGKSQLAANDTLDAIESLSRAGSFLPDDWEIQSALGVGYDRIGMYDQAAHRYEKALLLSPTNAVVLNNYALSLAQVGELGRATEMLEKATAVPERTAQMRQNLALLYAMSGRIEEAERLVRQDLTPELAAENIAYYRHLAKNSKRGIPKLPAAPGAGSDSGRTVPGASTTAGPIVPSAPVAPVARTRLSASEERNVAPPPSMPAPGTGAPATQTFATASSGAPLVSAPNTETTTPMADKTEKAESTLPSSSDKGASIPSSADNAGATPSSSDKVASTPPSAVTLAPTPPADATVSVARGSDAVATDEAKSQATLPAMAAAGITKAEERKQTRSTDRTVAGTTPAAPAAKEAEPDTDAAPGSKPAAVSAVKAAGNVTNARPGASGAVATPAAMTAAKPQAPSRTRQAAVYDDNAVAARLQAASTTHPSGPSPGSSLDRAPASTPEKKAQPAAERQASLPTTSRPAAGGAAGPIYRVQLGSYRNQADANHGISLLRSSHDDVFAGVDLDIVHVTLPESGAYFRILTGPFVSRDDASEVCRELQSREVSCFVRRD